MKFEMTFKTLDTDNKTIKSYDYHPLYNELRNTFDSFLGSPVDIVDEKYHKVYRDFDYIDNEIPMIKKTLTYSVALDEIAHLNATINLLENLDLDCGFKIKED